ncbi:Hypothetical predicted protein [Paramuricea clavata]|uniref:Uncharacterized protein n=1 Tax=Paramuricea clavata TaxID=317549 RepID=A0A7D9HBH3_PARCT|nr:Hypothetical predicted protein [Paramuricea clavata]
MLTVPKGNSIRPHLKRNKTGKNPLRPVVIEEKCVSSSVDTGESIDFNTTTDDDPFTALNTYLGDFMATQEEEQIPQVFTKTIIHKGKDIVAAREKFDEEETEAVLAPKKTTKTPAKKRKRECGIQPPISNSFAWTRILTTCKPYS